MDWMDLAKCKEYPTTIFYPEGEAKGRRGAEEFDNRTEAEAKIGRNVCYGAIDQKPCLVRKQCLDFAIISNIENGVYGGESAEARKKIARRRKKAQAQKAS